MTEIVDTYLTVDKPSEGFYKEKGSKFLAFAYPVNNEEEIKELLLQLRKDQHAARHHCYAWKLGMDDNNWRANDDGEPNNSAGKPIYGQILSKSLTNVLIIVVRYFGGTKLGVGGLITAYKTAAEESLNNATIIQKQVMTHFQISFEYLLMNDVMSLLKTSNVDAYDQDFTLTCKLKAAVALSQAAMFLESLEKIEGVNVKELFTQ